MSDTYELWLSLKKNGKDLPGYAPLVKRLTVAQSQSFDDVLVSGGGATSLPIGLVGTLSLLLIQVDQTETLSLGDIVLSAGGLVLMWNGANTTETITNASGSDALNRGLAGGT